MTRVAIFVNIRDRPDIRSFKSALAHMDQPMEPQTPKSESSEMERLAHQSEPGLITEFWGFLRQEGKWWLIPIVIVLLLLGLLVFLSTTGLAPFIYPVF
jgi:hypothetical protein